MASFLLNESGLPLVFSNGLPASLDELNEAQLECFLKYIWDFTEVPAVARVLPPRTINPRTRIHNFKTIIRNVYARLGCRYLLHLSEGIALKCNRKTLLFDHVTLGNQKLVNIYDERRENLIVSVPRSNLTYDLALQQRLKEESSTMGYTVKKNTKHGGDVKEIISLIDSDDEDSSDDIIFVPNPDATQISKTSFKTQQHSPKICTSNTMKKKSDIEKYLSFQNTELILLPNPNAIQKNFKLSNESDSVPKIEYSISLPADNASNISYFISSDSESEKNFPLVDPLAIDMEGQDKSITLDTDSDSKDEPKAKPEVLKLSAKKISPVNRTVAFEMKRYFREVTPPNNCGNESSSSSNRQQVVITKRILNEKPYPSNQTYSQIKHAKGIKRKVLNDSRKEKSNITKSQKVLNDRRKEKSEITKSQKVKFANALGLYELSDSMDDEIIILPEVNRKHFTKFHRLPLSLVPYLVAKDLINEASLLPGPPGQNSSFTSTDNIDLTRRRSGRTCSSTGRYRMNDLKKARNYIFPNKTYRTRTPVPLPTKKRKTPGPPLFPKPNKISKLSQVLKPETACSNKVIGPKNVPQVMKPKTASSKKLIGPKSVVQGRKKVTNITDGATQPDSPPSIKENGPSTMCDTSSLDWKLKAECRVIIQKLNPFIVRYYSKKLY